MSENWKVGVLYRSLQKVGGVRVPTLPPPVAPTFYVCFDEEQPDGERKQ